MGDSLGAPLEFIPVTLSSSPESPHFDSQTFEYRFTPNSRFEIQPGQWTDDTSMAMCLADGLIENEGAYKGSDTRTRYDYLRPIIVEHGSERKLFHRYVNLTSFNVAS